MVAIDVHSHFTDVVSQDFFSMVCGEVLGSGIARTVYACKLRPDLVVKMETAGKHFQNIMEWEFWKEWQHSSEVRSWLAPCVDISPCGIVLFQKRTTPVPLDDYPSKLPRFLTDTKLSNYGYYKDQFVCHDYGLADTTVRLSMCKVNWIGADG